MNDADKATGQLQRLVGTWELEMTPPGGEAQRGGRASFEWMAGERFLVERWEVPVPEAPDGLAVIGWNEGRGTLLQHYFDSRGVTRVYEMELDEDGWRLRREQADFDPLDFRQRWTATISDDGDTIAGTWEIAEDGESYEHDFDLRYLRVREESE